MEANSPKMKDQASPEKMGSRVMTQEPNSPRVKDGSAAMAGAASPRQKIAGQEHGRKGLAGSSTLTLWVL